MKRALIVATVVGFLAAFERQDIGILRSMGYEVHCAADLAQNAAPDTLDLLRDAGAVLHDVPFSRSPFSLRNLEAYRALRRIMAREHFDLVHCHTPVGGVLGRIAAHRAHVPKVLYTAHGFHFYDGAPLRAWLLYYPVEKALAHWTDVLVTITSEDYQRAKAHLHADKVYYVPGVGVDTERYRPDPALRTAKRAELGLSDGDLLLLSVGELNGNKSHETVIRALALLDDPRIRSSIAGEGPLRDQLLALGRDLGVGDRARLLGYRSDVPGLLAAADLFLLPSHREGLNVSLMEAMSAGLPCLASDIRGNRDLIDPGGNGYLLGRDPQAWAEKIRILASDPALRARMGARGREKIQAFRRERVEEIMEREVYAGL